MPKEFHQLDWDTAVEDDCRHLVRLAVREDLHRSNDWTTIALVSHETQGAATIVAREPGVVAGLHAGRVVLEEMAPSVTWQPIAADGERVERGTAVARMIGPARNLLTCERIVLNFITRLTGIATQTARYVAAAAGGKARVYDTRKTAPGWRRLEKYAVRCGGGCNHRTGLFDAVLIKDNHLALGARDGETHYTPAEAVTRARAFVEDVLAGDPLRNMIVEVEVDTLAQLDEVLPAMPDIVLLDNMSLDELRAAAVRRDALAPGVELEASGGVRLDTITAIAATGIDRISVGALTHSAVALDLGLDWDTG